MKKLVKIPIMVLAIVGLGFGFFCCSDAPPGKIVQQERNLEAFTRIDLGVSGKLYISQGEKQSIIVKGDENDLKNLETKVSGNKLKIRYANFYRGHSRLEFYITIKDISELSVSGSGDMVAATPLKTGMLELNVSGSGTITLPDLLAESVNANIAGSGDISTAGNDTVSNYEVNISGSGSITALNQSIQKAEISISGSGTCKINTTEELSASIAGSGDVFYKGSPQINASVAGSGKIKKWED